MIAAVLVIQADWGMAVVSGLIALAAMAYFLLAGWMGRRHASLAEITRSEGR